VSRGRTADEWPLVVLTGGGTGGHVFPAVAIAQAFVVLGVPTERVRFVGSASGMEATLVPEAGFELTGLALRNFRRSLRPADLVGSARAFVALWVGVVRMLRFLHRWRAGVVVTVGGFASVPAVLAARLRRIPVVVVSYDAQPGLANRWAARVAALSAVAFEGSSLPRAVVTGAPIRAEIVAVDRTRDRAEARAALGVAEDRFLVVAAGGSLGSGKINDVIDAFVSRHRHRRDLAVRHVIGARNDDGQRMSRSADDGLLYQVVAFEDHMERCLAGCDLIVVRAGASTVAEVSAVGVPAVVVPWAAAAGDHQRANARNLADHHGAVVVDETDFDEPWLTDLVDRFMADRPALRQLGERAAAVGRRDGAIRIAEMALAVARGV
jgi:UDP-N-acetylglucosamine--N-acetylmuramyl-(pentapeptide) pyrophosphoryl-undecaprenol N-acetylglucosamine transferase